MILKTLKETICFIFNPRFESHTWKTRPDLRKYYVTELIKDTSLLGKTSSEIEALLGTDESKSQLSDRWMYTIGFIDKKKFYLVVEFYENRVKTVRCTYKDAGYARMGMM